MNDFRSPLHDVEGCPGCRPVVFDATNGKQDVRLSLLACEAYDAATASQRKAWHRVTCLSSRDFIDVNLAKQVAAAIEDRINDE